MIPPLAPPASDKDREHLADRVATAHRDYAAPPAPVRHLELADVVLTGRTSWVQAAPSEIAATETGLALDATEIQRVLANHASKVANPLRELARALLRFADQLDEQDIVPLGIHVCTAHMADPGSYLYGTGAPQVAHVVTTIRGVRGEWIEQGVDAEPAREQVAPADCPCRNWAVADIREPQWGVEHHPACDGTGQRKDQPGAENVQR